MGIQSQSMHIRKHKSVECPKSFFDKSGLNLHMQLHRNDKPFACNLCDYKSNQGSNLRTHYLKHEAPKLRCDECHKVFRHKGTLAKHTIFAHRPETKRIHYMCQFCNLRYLSKYVLKKNVKNHTGEPTEEECAICHKMYRRLRDHMVIHSATKKFNCTFCSKTFARANELKLHTQTHTGEKPYECKFCQKRFRQHAHYMTHLKRHTTERCYECHLCTKRYAEPLALKLHIEMHSGKVKKYCCQTCFKAFNERHHFREHSKVHLDPNARMKYECKTCGFKLLSKTNLAAHMKIHSEKRLNCLFCNHKFYRTDMLKQHMRKHTGEKPVVCKVCQMEFKTVQLSTSMLQVLTQMHKRFHQ